ncbi:MAG: aminoglycoside phosphotransferase family protein [Streptosporangiaceae bacterium]
MPDAEAGFSSSVVLPTLREACTLAGLDGEAAELLRLGENAIYQLAAAPVVVRIARSADRLRRVEKELCVARWLAAASVPAVRVYEQIDQPLLVDGRPVSFWHAVTGGDPAPTYADLARLLAAFYELGDCPCELSGFDPLRTLHSRLTAPGGVAAGDRDFLRARCGELNEQLQELTYALPTGPIHGDAHPRNLLTDNGQVVLRSVRGNGICCPRRSRPSDTASRRRSTGSSPAPTASTCGPGPAIRCCAKSGR